MTHSTFPEDDPIIANSPAGPQARLTSPRDIAAAVPHLLGFHPTNSLVVIFIRNRTITATARLDLPAPDAQEGIWTALSGGLRGSKADAAILIVYADSSADPVLRQCLRTCPVPVIDALRIHDQRLWVPTCTGGPDCCPPGVPLDCEPSSVLEPLMIRAGVAVARSRDDLSACLRPAAPAVITQVSELLQHLARTPPARLEHMAMYSHLDRARRERINGPVHLSTQEAALLLHCLSEREVRDACCSWGDPGWRLWLDLIPFAPFTHVPIVASLIGIHAYQHGDGAMALIAAQHALSADPSFVLAELIVSITQSAIAPADAGIAIEAATRKALVRLSRSHPDTHRGGNADAAHPEPETTNHHTRKH